MTLLWCFGLHTVYAHAVSRWSEPNWQLHYSFMTFLWFSNVSSDQNWHAVLRWNGKMLLQDEHGAALVFTIEKQQRRGQERERYWRCNTGWCVWLLCHVVKISAATTTPQTIRVTDLWKPIPIKRQQSFYYGSSILVLKRTLSLFVAVYQRIPSERECSVLFFSLIVLF